MEKLEKPLRVWPASLAAGIGSAVLYLICAFLIWIKPAETVKLFSTWFHGIDLTKIAAPFNPSSLLIGLVTIVIASGLSAALFVWLYNMCYNHCKRRGWLS